jgi:hypothetical protein
MEFKAQHDNQWLFCFFKVRDNDIRFLAQKNDKAEVIAGDRVEIFFRKDSRLESYYCVEIDPLGRIYDYRAAYYRKFDVDWSWPPGHLKVKALREATGYSVWAAFSLESLDQLGLLKHGKLEAGLFRGKCVRPDPANPEMRWISWVKPDSTTPDFHIPSSFGIFELDGK